MFFFGLAGMRPVGLSLKQVVSFFERYPCREIRTYRPKATFRPSKRASCSCGSLYTVASLFGNAVHLLHRKRECSTVSLARPHSHWSVGVALIW